MLSEFLAARLHEDEARVLREVEAKRKILAEHEHRSEQDRKFGFGPGSSPCRTLRALAAVWSDHPDYRAE